MTIIKHYINNRWNWDFDGSHAAYDVVSQITDKYKYDRNITPSHNDFVDEYKCLLKQYPRVDLKTQNISAAFNIKAVAPARDSETTLEDMSLHAVKFNR